jgi:hypothetical protein
MRGLGVVGLSLLVVVAGAGQVVASPVHAVRVTDGTLRSTALDLANAEFTYYVDNQAFTANLRVLTEYEGEALPKGVTARIVLLKVRSDDFDHRDFCLTVSAKQLRHFYSYDGIRWGGLDPFTRPLVRDRRC